jgi:protein phosphatase
MNLIAAALTDKGLHREKNEDRVWSQVYNPSEGETVGLFIVCDGMGGHLGGECASQWAIETVKRCMADYFCPKDPRATVKLNQKSMPGQPPAGPETQKSDVTKLLDDVREAITEANTVVLEYSRQNPEQAADAGTTITMAFAHGTRVVVANVGDSRAYVLRDQQLQQISKDHSLVAMMVDKKMIQPEEVYTHSQRNVIYRSLGQKSQVDIDTFDQTLQPGDYLMLCSDGLWEMVQDNHRITELIATAPDPAEACRNLVQAANANGGEDNIGVVVVYAAE